MEQAAFPLRPERRSPQAAKSWWDILDKDGSPDWGATALLAQVRIQGGICPYAYSPELRKLLYNPAMYARIDIDLQKRFASKYSLALWELCTDYLGAKRDYGETPWIQLTDFRQLMGIDAALYPSFKRVTEKVITPALAELNSLSDFRVTVEQQRRGRKVLALKCKMRRVAFLPEPAHKAGPVLPAMEERPPVVRALHEAGLSTADAFAIWQQGFAFVEAAVRPPETSSDPEAAFLRYVREKIDLLTRRQAVDKVDSRTGFLRQALHHNYANPDFAAAERDAAAAVQAQRQKDQKERRDRLKQRYDEVRRDGEQALVPVYLALAERAPDVLATAVATVLAGNAFLRQTVRADSDALAQYASSPALQSHVNPYLALVDPAQLEAARAPYQAQLADLQAQIDALA